MHGGRFWAERAAELARVMEKVAKEILWRGGRHFFLQTRVYSSRIIMTVV